MIVFSSFTFDPIALNYWWENTAGDYYNYNSTFYRYNFDGGVNYIADGGYDLFDDGNYISIAGASNAAKVNYGTIGNNYFVSSSNVWPFVLMGSLGTQSNSLRITIAGNVGTDGLGKVAKYTGSYSYGRYWTVCNYGLSNRPTELELWFTIENKYSSFTLTGDTRRTQDSDNYNNYVEISGQNVIFAFMLVSKLQGLYISSSEVRMLLNNVIGVLPLPTMSPTSFPSLPTVIPTANPTSIPTTAPSARPSTNPTMDPSKSPSSFPSLKPSLFPSSLPSIKPSTIPSAPSIVPTFVPTSFPSYLPTEFPTLQPSVLPTHFPTENPTVEPTYTPTTMPSNPSKVPTNSPTRTPTSYPTKTPSFIPSLIPTEFPTSSPSGFPTLLPTVPPSFVPTILPTIKPSTG